jgi:Xaa-Pro dipeptidase
MSIFTSETINLRKMKTSQAWDSHLKPDDCVLIFCGRPVTKPGGLDQTYPFLPHPMYFWITGYRRPFGISLYNISQGWVDFTHEVTQDEKIWENPNEKSDPGLPVNSLPEFLKKNGFNRVFGLGQLAENDFSYLKDADALTQNILKLKIDFVRRMKDTEEIMLLRNAANISKKGYDKIKSFIRPGVTEREIQIEFESEILRHGAHRTPYDSIVGSGKNSAVLHAVPTLKKVDKTDLVLIDAGVDIYDYCTDITRVFPASGKFTHQQQELYDLVKSAQAEGIKACIPGMEWHEVHQLTAKIIAEGLKTLGLLKGSVDSLLETGAISAFYPHGVGHLVGLRVRDVGVEENAAPKKYCGARLRVDLKIQENHLLTVEPGCYFIESLLKHPVTHELYKDMMIWPEIEKWMDVGGVRIEDNILITQAGPENLTQSIEK